MHKFELPEDYALVLQEVEENGTEDFDNIAESLQLDRSRLWHIIHVLQRKGLITIHNYSQDIWINLSTKGSKLITYMLPDSGIHNN